MMYNVVQTVYTHIVFALTCSVVGIEISQREHAPAPRVTSNGRAACQLCGRELSKVNHHRPSGPGRACAPRCKPQKHTLERVEEQRSHSTERPAKKQRRSKSDPGQPLPIASTRLRIRAPKPPPPTTKPRIMKPSINPVDPMALLEAAHARRVALLEEETNRAGSSTPNASSVVWQ
jgi:hypothetical protein